MIIAGTTQPSCNRKLIALAVIFGAILLCLGIAEKAPLAERVGVALIGLLIAVALFALGKFAVLMLTNNDNKL